MEDKRAEHELKRVRKRLNLRFGTNIQVCLLADSQ